MYNDNPTIPLIDNPVGLDAVIQSLQTEMSAGLPWLKYAFGRAFEMKEFVGEHDTDERRIPKVYVGNGEYLNVLPNDAWESYCFFATRTNETYNEYEGPHMGRGLQKTRPVSVIFWFDLSKLKPEKDYIYTEELKAEVEKILKRNRHVQRIDKYFDERVEDVFDGYVPTYRYAAYGVDQQKTHYMQHPWGGMRFDMIVGYDEYC